jgi:D-glycero-D-manno-heptose 1,7-bisphosphate phosphatase
VKREVQGLKPARNAVFLDRDGTINVEKDYLWRVEDFAFIDGAPQAIRRLNDAGFLVIVVTNQSGVARGLYRPEDVDRLHDHIRRRLDSLGARIDAFYICPHHPIEGIGRYRTECDCRKGAPGMLLQASADFGIELATSWIVGDKLADVEAGSRAGCRPILVRTGYGEAEKDRLGVYGESTTVVADLAAAVEFILINS